MRKIFYLFAVVLFLAGQYSSAQNITWQSAGLDGLNVSNFCITNNNALFAVLHDGTFRLSTNNGTNWVVKNLEPGTAINIHFHVAVDTSNNLYFSQFGGAYKSTNLGANWALISGSFSGNPLPEIYDIKVLPNQNILACTLSGTMVSTDRGISWTNKGGGAASGFVTCNNTLFSYGTGLSGMGIRKSTDNGLSWGLTSYSDDVWGMESVNAKLFVLGKLPTHFSISSNLGISWDSVNMPMYPNGAIFRTDKNNNLWAYFTYTNDTTKNGLYYSKDEGHSWTKTAFPYAVNALYADNSYNLYVCTGNGLYKIDTRVLPVELTSFTVSVKEGKPCLQWNTATEMNNSGFEIQRSYDKNVWNNVGFVKGMGTTSNPAEYMFVDNIPGQTGTVYYRLRQVDFNGASSISKEVDINLNKEMSYCLGQNYPNPFNPSTNISYSLPNDSYVSIKVYDVLGKEVLTLVNENKKAGSYQINLNCSNLNSGVYFYTMKAGSTSQTRKFVLMK